jgi:hypothetical protein
MLLALGMTLEMRLVSSLRNVAVLLALTPFAALAQSPAPSAGTNPPAASATAESRAAVQAIAGRYPAGGDGLKADVLRWLAANPGRYLAVFDVARTATPEQQLALGSALGEYTRSLRATDPLTAQQIQRDALNSGMPGFTTQYAIGSGDTQTAATGGGGGGGAGGGSGGSTSVFTTSLISNTGGGSTNEGTGSRHNVLSSSFLGGVSGSILGCTSTSTNRC